MTIQAPWKRLRKPALTAKTVTESTWKNGVTECWSAGFGLHYSIIPVFQLRARYLPMDQTRMAQPMRKAMPPMGVMAPNQRTPVRLRR
jgi:hypothetical protein